MKNIDVEPAKIGDFVRYNGKLKYAQNLHTRDLMIDNLTIGNYYEIVEVIHPYGGMNWSYRFKHCIRGYHYPQKSFDYCIRDFLINKYKLR